MIAALILLPLTLALAAVGGLGTFATLVSPHHARSAPRFGFACLLAAAGGVVLAFSAADIAGRLSLPAAYELYACAFGYVFGALAGADIGHRAALYYERNVWPRRKQPPPPAGL